MRAVAPDTGAITGDQSDLQKAFVEFLHAKAEAEPLMRRALAIDEKSLVPDHPNVAFRLNNFARLLHDTNRLAEAEPLIWRAPALLVEFTCRTGHRHPRLDAMIANYGALLKAMDKAKRKSTPRVPSWYGRWRIHPPPHEVRRMVVERPRAVRDEGEAANR